jgi:pimeloyl-ACP methyl ester carboxylesterase
MKDNLPDIGVIKIDEIDGLNIRYTTAGIPGGVPVLLTAPWPESIYAFHRLIPRLAINHFVIAVDLPGFGHSQSRPDVMAPEAMGDFLIKLIHYFQIKLTHVVAPDVGTPAVLFAATKQPGLFESLVIGCAAMLPDLADGILKELIYSPTGALAEAGADGVKPYLDHAALLTPSAIIEDFKAGSVGSRLDEATQFVRAYVHDSPILEPKLSDIKTPSLIIGGKNDTIVPPVNGQFLANRLPNNRYLLLGAAHRVWEEAVEEYIETVAAWINGSYLPH